MGFLFTMFFIGLISLAVMYMGLGIMVYEDTKKRNLPRTHFILMLVSVVFSWITAFFYCKKARKTPYVSQATFSCPHCAFVNNVETRKCFRCRKEIAYDGVVTKNYNLPLLRIMYVLEALMALAFVAMIVGLTCALV